VRARARCCLLRAHHHHAPRSQIKDEIAKYKVGAPARVGLLAPNDVMIAAGGTGMDPSQTSFFQVCVRVCVLVLARAPACRSSGSWPAGCHGRRGMRTRATPLCMPRHQLTPAPAHTHTHTHTHTRTPRNTRHQALAIATKINKGTIEIVSDVHLIKAGDKVGASEAALLGKLGVKPFKYGLEILKVYDNGSLFEPAVLDITDDDLVGAVAAAASNVAALSLAVDYPTLASLPHSLINGYKNVLAIALETEYSFPLADKVRCRLWLVGCGGGRLAPCACAQQGCPWPCRTLCRATRHAAPPRTLPAPLQHRSRRCSRTQARLPRLPRPLPAAAAPPQPPRRPSPSRRRRRRTWASRCSTEGRPCHTSRSRCGRLQRCSMTAGGWRCAVTPSAARALCAGAGRAGSAALAVPAAGMHQRGSCLLLLSGWLGVGAVWFARAAAARAPTWM
jgi:hypothetical protein